MELKAVASIASVPTLVEVRTIRPAPLSAPVSFHGEAHDILPPALALLGGWQVAPNSGEEPVVKVARSAAGYRIAAPWLDTPIVERDPFRAAGHLAVDLIEAWLAEHSDRLTLHCAAVLLGGRLVLLAGPARTGKSLLAGRLAAAGIPVFTDDVLPLDDDDRHGLSLGMRIRLRMPLPLGAGDALSSLATSGIGDRDYRYLDLPAAVAPRLGRRAPVGAIVRLDRRPALKTAELDQTGAADGLDQLLRRSMSERLSAADSLARLAALATSVPCFVLRYTDPGAALDVLTDRFSKGDWPETSSTRGTVAPGNERPQLSSSGERFVATSVMIKQVDNEAFVIGKSGETLRLDPLARGVWSLLDTPTSIAEASAVVAGAFPETDRRKIADDVATLFDRLSYHGLIRRA